MEEGRKPPGKMELRETDELTGSEIIDAVSANSAIAKAIKKACPGGSSEILVSQGPAHVMRVTIPGLVQISINNGYVTTVSVPGDVGSASGEDEEKAFREWSPSQIAVAKVHLVSRILDAVIDLEVGPPVIEAGDGEEDADGGL